MIMCMMQMDKVQEICSEKELLSQPAVNQHQWILILQQSLRLSIFHVINMLQMTKQGFYHCRSDSFWKTHSNIKPMHVKGSE